MATKRKSDDVDADADAASHPFSTLSVFSYTNDVQAVAFARADAHAATQGALHCLFAPPSSRASEMFSYTASADGVFVLVDAAAAHLLGGARGDAWRCLYIHEGSTDKKGDETEGTIAALSARLAAEEVSVLDVTTLARNFMLVRADAAERALRTLQESLSRGRALLAARPQLSRPPPLRLALLPPRLAIGALSLAELPACAHALLRLVFLPRSPHAFLHYFEMGGEVSLIVEEAPLDALCADGGGGDDACAGGEALRAALAPSLSRGWRAISVAAAQGAEAVGILSALTSRIRAPIMNVSSLDTNFILVRDADVAAVRAQLLPDYEIAQ